jgi:hypothetical protein
MSYVQFSRAIIAVIFVCVGLVLLAGLLWADKVHLKGGGFIDDCRVVRKTPETLHLRTPKRAQVKDNDVNGLFRLAQWCQQTAGLREDMEAVLKDVLRLDENHVSARMLLGYVRDGKKWRKPPPLSLCLRVNGNKELKSDLWKQLSIQLRNRKDLHLDPDCKNTDKPNACELVAKVTTGRASSPSFYGVRLRGPVATASVTIEAQGKWLGGQGPKPVVLKGETPAATPGAEKQALADAVTREPHALQKFYDRLTEVRTRKLQAALRTQNAEKKKTTVEER